jgi:predicted DNA-binding transcriptional regulator AlpA
MATQPLTPAPDGASSIFPEYLTRHELAQGLRKTVRSIDRLILHGEAPPYVQVGSTKLFRREAVAQWLRSRETPARPQTTSRRGAR